MELIISESSAADLLYIFGKGLTQMKSYILIDSGYEFKCLQKLSAANVSKHVCMRGEGLHTTCPEKYLSNVFFNFPFKLDVFILFPLSDAF